MTTIQDIVQGAGSKAVTIRGKSLTVRALTAAETMRSRRLWARPQPPYAPDPRKSAADPWVPHELDPKYQRELEEWRVRCSVVQLALSLDWQTADGLTCHATDDNEARKWGLAAFEEIARTFTEAELDAINRGIDTIGMSAEEIRGN